MLATLALAPLLLQAVSAQYCYGYGCNRYRRGGLSNGGRIGVGIAAAVVFVILMSLCLFARRRRSHRANLVYAQQQQAEMGQAGNPQYGQPQTQQANNGMFGNMFHHNKTTQPQTDNSAYPNDIQQPPPTYGNQNYSAPAGAPPGAELTSEQRETQQHEEMLRQQNGGASYAPPAGPPPTR